MLHIIPLTLSTSWSLVKALDFAKATEKTKSRVHIELIDQIGTALKFNEKYYDVPTCRTICVKDIPFLDCAVSADLLLYIYSRVSRGELNLKGSIGAQLLKANMSPYGKPAYGDISLTMT